MKLLKVSYALSSSMKHTGLSKGGVEVHVIRSKMEEEHVSYGIHFHGLIKGRDHTLIPYNFLARITGYPPISLVRRPAALSWENLYALSVSKVMRKRNVDLIHAISLILRV